MRKGIWIYSFALACGLAMAATGDPRSPRELEVNAELGEDSPPLPPGTALCSRPAVEQVPPATLAIIVIPGPLNSTQLAYEIWNYSGDSITAVQINGFDALGGQGLLFSKVATSHAAQVGSVRVEYPQVGVDGRGPIVVGFTGFGSGQCAAINSEASTWGDAGFHGRVMDAVGVRIEVVFEQGLRGSGEVSLCGSNGRFARNVPCHPGDAVAAISGSRTSQVRLSQ